MKKVGIIGCGAILKRHIESIEKNKKIHARMVAGTKIAL